ncbi:S-adenosyl-L-methionine-dependent methyltransferase [Aspergillus recurvatus]
MASVSSGIAVTKIFTSPPLLGFLPVAAHFELFDILVQCGKPVTGEEIVSIYKSGPREENKGPVPGLPLIQDSLHAMAGLSLIDAPAENTYCPNAMTQHLVAQPSALHGGIHFSTEILLASAFLFPKLQASNFSYPFRECETPMQFAHQCMGNQEYARMHTYAIMAEEGRMDSFNTFMTSKFFDVESNAVRLQKLGYDIGSVLKSVREDGAKMVDIGGGRGEMLLDFRDALPDLELTDSDLVVEEFNDDIGDIPGITLVRWDYKSECPQPIKGAVIYHLAHVVHNLPDLDAVRLLKKIRDAMAPYSRILVHEMARSTDMAFLHAAMMVLFGGRERSPAEFGELAKEAGLRVTFEAFPKFGDGVMELMM